MPDFRRAVLRGGADSHLINVMSMETSLVAIILDAEVSSVFRSEGGSRVRRRNDEERRTGKSPGHRDRVGQGPVRSVAPGVVKVTEGREAVVR